MQIAMVQAGCCQYLCESTHKTSQDWDVCLAIYSGRKVYSNLLLMQMVLLVDSPTGFLVFCFFQFESNRKPHYFVGPLPTSEHPMPKWVILVFTFVWARFSCSLFILLFAECHNQVYRMSWWQSSQRCSCSISIIVDCWQRWSFRCHSHDHYTWMLILCIHCTKHRQVCLCCFISCFASSVCWIWCLIHSRLCAFRFWISRIERLLKPQIIFPSESLMDAYSHVKAQDLWVVPADHIVRYLIPETTLKWMYFNLLWFSNQTN